MLNWVAIYRRLLRLYNVHTQQELGMALGIPFSFGLEGEAKNDPIPWPILEMVVMHKNLSWDWLLTGKFYHNANGSDGLPARAAGRRPTEQDDPLPDPPEPRHVEETRTEQRPRIETRELMRRLLAVEKNQNGHAAHPPPPEPPPPEVDGAFAKERSWPIIEAAPPPPEEPPPGSGPAGDITPEYEAAEDVAGGFGTPPAAPPPPQGPSPPGQAGVKGGRSPSDAKKDETVILAAPIPLVPLAAEPPATPGKPTASPTSGTARMIAELEELKNAMESELMKVDNILRGRRRK